MYPERLIRVLSHAIADLTPPRPSDGSVCVADYGLRSR
jgi:hypothetical protein